jgi:hypothetical protein
MAGFLRSKLLLLAKQEAFQRSLLPADAAISPFEPR